MDRQTDGGDCITCVPARSVTSDIHWLRLINIYLLNWINPPVSLSRPGAAWLPSAEVESLDRGFGDIKEILKQKSQRTEKFSKISKKR